MIPYSQQFRNRMVQKLVGAHAVSATALSAEVGISQGTLSRWLKQAATIPSKMSSADNDIKAHDWSPEEKVAFVLELAAVPSTELGALLRRKGVLEAQLDEWRKQVTDAAVASMRPPTRGDREAAAADTKKIRQLERELLRKDKALAETAALLVLKKKPRQFGGTRTTTPTRRATNDPHADPGGRRCRRSSVAGVRGPRPECAHRGALGRQ